MDTLHAITEDRETCSASHREDSPCIDPRPGLRHALEDTVAQVFAIERERLSQPTRGEAAVARARQVAMYLAHTSYGLSLTEVGELFGRDRTTVAHACRLVEEHREDLAFDRAMDLLEGVVRVLAGTVTTMAPGAPQVSP